MNPEHGSGYVPEEAQKAHTEYQYAAAKENVPYGEEPEKVESYKEAEAFIRDLEYLNPNWEELDFSRVDLEHMNSLTNDEQRSAYVIEQLLSNQPEGEDKATMANKLAEFLRKHERTIGRLSGLAAVLASLTAIGGVITHEVQQDEAAQGAVAQAMNEGRLRVHEGHHLTLGEQKILANWMTKHPGATIDMAKIDRDANSLSGQGLSDVEMHITENGQTHQIHGHGEVHQNLFPEETEEKINSTLQNTFESEEEAEKVNTRHEQFLGNIAEKRAVVEALNSYEQGPKEQ